MENTTDILQIGRSKYKPGVTIDNSNLVLFGYHIKESTKYVMTENDRIIKMPGMDILMMTINGNRKNLFTIFCDGVFADIIE